jgi:hypothetical protein
MNGEAEAGSRLGSLYVLDQRIGSGGMGTVWSAHHTDTGEAVAVKILSENLAQDPDLVGRFLRERTALMNVHHPNLVEIRDLVVENQRVALVMELVEGYDAARLLEQNGPLPLRETARLGSEIAQALLAVHAGGIVHRDLKPANMLVEAGTGRARLVDFGIAWIANNPRLTAANSVVGTPHYLAPELLTGGDISPAADIYALAICLYQLLSGTVPFDGEHYAQILQKHLNEAPRPHPAIPATLWSVIEAMLAKNPAMRPDLQFVARQLTMFGGGSVPAPLQLPTPAAASAQIEPRGYALPGQIPMPQAPGTPVPSGAGTPMPFGPGTPVPGQGTPVPSSPGIPMQSGQGTPIPGQGTPVPGGGGYQEPDQSLYAGLAPQPEFAGYDPQPAQDPWSGGAPFSPNPPPFQPLAEPERRSRRTPLLIVALVLVLCGIGAGAWALTGAGGGAKPVAGPTASVKAAPPKLAVHHWTLCCGQLQDRSGNTTATDNGVVLNTVSNGDAAFNGKPGTQIVVDGPVIDTKQSFTIAFWMIMHGTTSAPSGRETMVEQRGTEGCAACVEFDPTTGRVAFSMQSADSAGAHVTQVIALAQPVTGTWYRIIASYNAANGNLSLYIGGVLQGTAKFTPDWAPTGPLSFGSGLEGGVVTNWYSGALADMWLWNRAMTPAQVNQATK